MKDKEKKIKRIVKEELSCSAHDFDHTQRVYNTCLKIAENKEVDLEVIKFSALLHDIARVEEDNDPTGKIDHAVLGAQKAEEILKDFNFEPDKIKKIKSCILSHRYKNDYEPNSEEAKILFDADKLDVLGAIGVARSFVWVGRNNANIYREVDIDDYKKNNLEEGRIKDSTKHSPQIEFEIKIKHLKERMYTEEGKKMAKKRLEFFKDFLSRLEKEVKGKK